MRGIALAAVAAACALAAGCGNDVAQEPPKASTTEQKAPGLGDPIEFARADTGAKIGNIRFHEVVALSAECLTDPLPAGAQAIAARVEIANAGALILPNPDGDTLKVNDAGGYTQPTHTTYLTSTCEDSYPKPAPSQPSGKTVGWIALQIQQPNPTALVYSPYVFADGATLESLDLIKTAPISTVINLPNPLPAAKVAAQAPAPTNTTEAEPAPPPTTKKAPAAPAAGQPCNPAVDDWGKDASGGQLKCAYAGGPTPKWVHSAPLIGTREPGSSCDIRATAVAVSPSGDTLVCVGGQGDSTWQPGP